MMPDPALLAWLGAATLVAATLQSATGFGFAVLAVPAYLAVLPAATAIQVNILICIVVMAVMTTGLWRVMPWPTVARFGVGAALGAPLGLLFLTRAPETWVKLAVGAILSGFLVYLVAGRLRRRRAPGGERTSPARPAPAAEGMTGALGGLLGAGLGMPGPPLLIYFGLRHADKSVVRPAIMAFLMVAFIGIGALNWATVGFPAQTLHLAAWVTVPALAGCAAGHWLSGRLSQNVFDAVTLGALTVTALGMLWSVIG